MGFFDNIKNTFKRIFTPKKYEEEQKQKKAQEEETLKKEEETKIQQELQTIQPSTKPKIKEEQIQPLSKPETQQIETIPEDIPEEALTTKGQKIRETQKTIEGVGTINVDKTIADSRKQLKDLYKGVNIQSEREVNQITRENLTETSKEIEFGIDEDGLSYSQKMKEAILANQIRVDENIAELIVQHSDKFKSRFTTKVNMWLSGNREINIPDIIMVFQGALPHEIAEELKEEFRENETTEPTSLMKKIRDFEYRLIENGKTKGTQVIPNRILANSETITKMRTSVTFR